MVLELPAPILMPPTGAVKVMSETAVTARGISIGRLPPPEEVTTAVKVTLRPAAEAAAVTVKLQLLRDTEMCPSVMSCPVASAQVKVLEPSVTYPEAAMTTPRPATTERSVGAV